MRNFLLCVKIQPDYTESQGRQRWTKYGYNKPQPTSKQTRFHHIKILRVTGNKAHVQPIVKLEVLCQIKGLLMHHPVSEVKSVQT